MPKSSVIIIGGGAAGLLAASELAGDFEVLVLEALPRIGGRIHSHRIGDTIIEAGAEFIHGNVPLTLELLQRAGISYAETAGEMYRKSQGRFTEAAEMTEDWNGLLEKMEAEPADLTVKELLEKHFSGERYVLFRKHVRSYAEGFDLADISRASVKGMLKEWKEQEYTNFRIPAGYSRLMNYLADQAKSKGARVVTGQPVSKVHWQRGEVSVQTREGNQWTAARLLVTVPVSMLQKQASGAGIKFMPPVDIDQSGSGIIGFGAVIKLVFRFKRSFWQVDAGFILSDELIPTWWTQLPDPVPLITGWVGGLAASELSSEGDESLVEIGLGSLAAIYDLPVETLKEQLEHASVFNWQRQPYILGGYSYATVDGEAARTSLSVPLEDTLFFAGEAVYSGDHPGTVEAALVSGREAADRVKRSVPRV